MDYYLITFSNTHTAIAAQKFLTGKIPFLVMPTLREISSSCGISIKITEARLEEIKELLHSFEPSASMYTLYFIGSNGSVITSIN